MASDGNLYRIERPVARLNIDGAGRIMGAAAAIHTSMPGFVELQLDPPGDDTVIENKKTPFVWAEEHYD